MILMVFKVVLRYLYYCVATFTNSFPTSAAYSTATHMKYVNSETIIVAAVCNVILVPWFLPSFYKAIHIVVLLYFSLRLLVAHLLVLALRRLQVMDSFHFIQIYLVLESSGTVRRPMHCGHWSSTATSIPTLISFQSISICAITLS